MNYRIVHTTRYTYSEPVCLCHNEARLTPRTFARQTPGTTTLKIDPAPADLRAREDFFGNCVSYFSIQQPHRSLTVTATSEVRVEGDAEPRDFSGDAPWDMVRERLRTDTRVDIWNARPYVMDSPLVAGSVELARYAERSFPRGRPLLQAVLDLMQRIHRDFTYDPDFTTIATPLAEVLKHRRGVCQDFAHLAIGCLRARGLAARYHSGYIETAPPSGEPRLTGADASHAWFSVFLPDTGWRDFDPTNNQMPMDRHITLGWGRDYSDVAPLKGVIFGGGSHRLAVSVDVANLDG